MSTSIWTTRFWKEAIDRAVKSGAQAALIVLGGEAFNVWTLDWAQVGGITLGGFLLSVLTSLGSNALPFGDKGSASVIKLGSDPA